MFRRPISSQYLYSAQYNILLGFGSLGFCMPTFMAFSSPFDIAERSADYWKRQLTLEETVNLSCWISLLNRHSFCQWAFAITLILMGKGWVYRSECHWDHHSLFVEHPQQHILKLRKHILRYFLLIQFFTALQILVAETQEYFSISNPTHVHSLWTVSRLVNCCNSWKNTTGLDLFRPPLSLHIGLKQ